MLSGHRRRNNFNNEEVIMTNDDSLLSGFDDPIVQKLIEQVLEYKDVPRVPRSLAEMLESPYRKFPKFISKGLISLPLEVCQELSKKESK